MKSERAVYFDTNAFNAALDRPKEFRNSVASCPQVLLELAATHERDPIRAQALCKTFAQLVGPRLLRPASERARMEISPDLNKDTERGIYFGKPRYDRVVKPILERFCAGDFTSPFVSSWLEKIQGIKKWGLDFTKTHGYAHESETASNFVGMLSKFPQELLVLSIAQTAECWKIELTENQCVSILQNRKAYPHFWAFSFISYAMMYLYRKNKSIKPKHGLQYDMTIILSSIPCSTFITDDTDARELYKILFPSKEVLGYDKFCIEPKVARVGEI